MFKVVVDRTRRCHDVAMITVIIPFAPAADAFLKARGGVRVEVIGRAENADDSAADVVVAERIRVLVTTSGDLHG